MDYYNKGGVKMDEIEEKPKEEEPATENFREGIQQETTKDIDRLDESIERRNRVCEREEKILAQKDANRAREAVSGELDAGSKLVEKKEESPKEYNERINKEISEGKHDD